MADKPIELLSDDALADRIADLGNVIHQATNRLHVLRREQKRLRQERGRRANDLRRVSDHAVVRFLERSAGVPIDRIRDMIRRRAEESTPFIDGEHHWHPSGIVIVIGDEGQVVTVLDADLARKWAHRKLKNGQRSDQESSNV